MYGADEKKAFEDMLAEIGEDSDEEDVMSTPAGRNHGSAKSVPKEVADRKSHRAQEVQQASAKSYAGSSSSGSTAYQRGQAFQMSKEDEEIARFGIDTAQSAAQMQTEQVNITKRWLMRSCSAGERNTMKCFVERERSTFGMQTTYRCYLENPTSGGGGSNRTDSPQGAPSSNNARFLMSAKKRVVNKTSYYLISLDNDANDDRGSESVLGKVSRA
jgi:hypothetical protein